MYETHKQADTTKVGNIRYHFVQLEDGFIFLPRQTYRSSKKDLDLWNCIGREKSVSWLNNTRLRALDGVFDDKLG